MHIVDRRPYNQIIRCSNDPLYDPLPVAEDLTMLYRPLFWTSFWCEDWLYSSKYHGANRILISSASAKTAFCLAYRIKMRMKKDGLSGLGLRVVGLTSRRNLDFTRRLGLYDDVTEYGMLETDGMVQPGKEKWVYVDVAGNDGLNDRVASHLGGIGGSLVGAFQLGLTNLTPSSSSSLASTTPSSATSVSNQRPEVVAKGPRKVALQLFFMPEWFAVRSKELSVRQIAKLQAEAWREFLVDGRDWVKLEQIYGGNNVEKAYRSIVRGELGPERGMIWSMWGGPLAMQNDRAKL